ncbi:MAG: tripartite tricarboxylate transporter substrate binding protein BugD [Hyphomicrobiales bacterium]|nr:tripartite tricarboxylate transporter substrate binding protein BugD [Hyphomicrobiales bacterium]
MAACAVMLPSEARRACAQGYPQRPITLVVPYGAGGPSDIVARLVADAMRPALGQPIVIENVAGASGTIGVGRVARSAPDGYTLNMGGWATHVLNGATLSLAYDPLLDFEPIVLISRQALTIAARKTMAAGTLSEFITWLKAHPGEAMQGTTGAGGISAVGGLLFQKETGTRVRFVPYRIGLAAAMQDLVGGQIDFMIDSAVSSLPQWRAGAIKIYAVTADARLAAAPDIPTVAEAGWPGLAISSWFSLYAPKGTPKEIVDKLNAAGRIALADESVRRRLSDLGQEVVPPEQQSPQFLAELHKAEVAKW